MTGRFPIEDVTPCVACGRYPAKAVVGELVPISAVSYREGHATLGVNVVWQGPDGPVRELVTSTSTHALWVDRKRALFSAWYEFFPRSEGAVVGPHGEPVTHGTFATAARRLRGVADMGFDILYLPPIHPIGRVNRKGRNNALVAAPGDVGSPWAIGAAEGGHDAIHPDLGTLADFRRFIDRARNVGLEVAMDLALQCAPDQPWVYDHSV